MHELEDWKRAIAAAVDGYVIDPCGETALALANARALFCPEAWIAHAGITAAIDRELGIRAGFPLSSRIWSGLHCFLRACTWQHPTWDEYFSLRWLFRKEAYCVRELHSRCHLKDGSARAHVLRLLRDGEFRRAFELAALGAGCTECAELFAESLEPAS